MVRQKLGQAQSNTASSFFPEEVPPYLRGRFFWRVYFKHAKILCLSHFLRKKPHTLFCKMLYK